MGLSVERLDSDATKIGLTRESVRLAAESRLRAARLYDARVESASEFLSVRVSVVGRAFDVGFEYFKAFLTDKDGNVGGAATGATSVTGTHANRGTLDGAYIMSTLVERLDEFIADYMRVNAADCGGPSAP